jgi:hypothetical protein
MPPISEEGQTENSVTSIGSIHAIIVSETTDRNLTHFIHILCRIFCTENYVHLTHGFGVSY